MIKRTDPKELDELTVEWDNVCEQRQELISSGADVSLTMVTVPYIIDKLKRKDKLRVLDVGCGTGYLTNQISEAGNACIGIDSSKKSIQIAKSNYKRQGLSFKVCNAKSYNSSYLFDVCVANMVLMDDPEWIKSIANIYRLLKSGGYFISTITHPWFWPRYWGYEDEAWFEYDKEIFIECPFVTTFSDVLGTTTHIHRPLSSYINGLRSEGFSIECIDELLPNVSMPKEYETRYPKFLAFICRKDETR